MKAYREQPRYAGGTKDGWTARAVEDFRRFCATRATASSVPGVGVGVPHDRAGDGPEDVDVRHSAGVGDGGLGGAADVPGPINHWPHWERDGVTVCGRSAEAGGTVSTREALTCGRCISVRDYLDGYRLPELPWAIVRQLPGPVRAWMAEQGVSMPAKGARG